MFGYRTQSNDWCSIGFDWIFVRFCSIRYARSDLTTSCSHIRDLKLTLYNAIQGNDVSVVVFVYAGGIGKHNCRHTEDAGVKCSGPDMSKRCVTSCGDGFFRTPGNKCERCLLKCKTCKDKADSCTSCDFPFFYANSSSDCVTKCPPGFYGNTKERLCKPCDNVCLTCSNGETGDQCQSCPKGLFLSKSLVNLNSILLTKGMIESYKVHGSNFCSCGVTIQMNPLQQSFHMVLFPIPFSFFLFPIL